MKNFYSQFISFAVVKCVEDFGKDSMGLDVVKVLQKKATGVSVLSPAMS